MGNFLRAEIRRQIINNPQYITMNKDTRLVFLNMSIEIMQDLRLDETKRSGIDTK